MDALIGALQLIQGMLPESGYAIGEWSIADATFIPFLLRLDCLLRNRHVFGPWPGRTEEELKTVLDALDSPRFARLQKYLQDNMSRPSMAVTWDEVCPSYLRISWLGTLTRHQ